MLCYSTGSLPDAFSLNDVRETLAPTLFRGVELVMTPFFLERADDQEFWSKARKDFGDAGLVFRNVHMGNPLLLSREPHVPGIASLDEHGRRLKLEAILQSMRVAGHLGAPHITLTTGYPEVDLPRQLEIFGEVLLKLVEAKPLGLKILIEQEPEHIIHSTGQLLELAGRHPGEVFATFDVGHSQVEGEDVAASVESLGSIIRNLHLEDIKDGVHRHLLYGDGDIDFPAIFSALRKIGYVGDITPDLYPFKDGYREAIAASEAFLREHLSL